MKCLAVHLAAALLAALPSAASWAAPPDSTVRVVRPVPGKMTRYLETTGSVAAMQQVDLMARVSGTLQSIEVADGTVVRKGTVLFVVEPAPYESKLRQAQAAEAQQRALNAQAEAEHNRQVQLQSSSASSRATLDNALASRDNTRAALQGAEEATRQAAITYAYTRVLAPFDGIMTAHLVSTGAMVGFGNPTKLATLMQLDPIWVNAAISEADVTRIRTALAEKGQTVRSMGPVPVEVALAGEDGFPHRGVLDYVAPSVDTSSGTLAIRARLDNPGYALLPGYFVRVRIAVDQDAAVLLLPRGAVAFDQGTPTVFIVDADGTVRQQKVRLGQASGDVRAGDMQVVEGGLKADDRVIAAAAAPPAPGARVRAVDVPAPSAQP